MSRNRVRLCWDVLACTGMCSGAAQVTAQFYLRRVNGTPEYHMPAVAIPLGGIPVWYRRIAVPTEDYLEPDAATPKAQVGHSIWELPRHHLPAVFAEKRNLFRFSRITAKLWCSIIHIVDFLILTLRPHQQRTPRRLHA